jgi:negative regulator of sigma E activity
VKKDEMNKDAMQTELAAQPALDVVGEQLSAMLDGELSADEARFAQRRLASDPALRARWARMQVGASCMRNQPWLPMAPDLSQRVAAALAVESASAPRRAPRVVGWAVAASVAALSVAFAPRYAGDAGAPPAPAVAATAATAATARPVATLASADLVASSNEASPSASPATPAQVALAPAGPVAPLLGEAPVTAARAGESPLAATIESPTDFPLLQTGDKTWPRSALAGADAPALEAYLVRHNQMMANDGLSGFVPYVDIVATDAPGADGANAAADPEPMPDAPATDAPGTPAP